MPAPISAPVAGASEADLLARVRGWAAAWTAKNYSDYMNFYAPTFTPDGGLTREDWAQLRRGRIATRDNIGVELQDMTVKMDGTDRAFVSFRQVYTSNQYRDTTQKTMEMIRTGGKWLINRESSVPCFGAASGGCKR
jgi:adhesin transport system outer membrane protein